MKQKHFFPIAFFALWGGIHAQSALSVEQAVAIALKNNFDILVAKNDAEAAAINNAAGNAGMLPTVGLTGSNTYSNSAVDQKPSTGSEFKDSAVGSNSFNAGVALNWTLFDGGKMFITKKKLGELETLGAIQLKDRILQTVYTVIAGYYDVVRQKQQLASLQDVITYNQDRVTIEQTSFTAGLSPKTTYLQAQIDLNVFKESAINQQTVITTAKRTLNQLLSRDAETAFDVPDSIILNFTPDTSRIRDMLFKNNTSVLSQQKLVDVAELSLREFKTLRYPKISLSAGYGLLRTDNTAGSTLLSQSFGPSVGVGFSLPLYQAGAIDRQIETARLQVESSRYDLENVKNIVIVQTLNALDEFENQTALLKIERDNVALAKENLDISMQRLRYGQSTSLELRQAEESYEDSRTRLINIAYNLKIAEAKLKQLLAQL